MSEKVALITGAAGGLGQAFATILAAEGYQLIVTSRDTTRLSDIYGNKHLQITTDCSTFDGAKHIFEVANAHNLEPTAFAHCVGNFALGHYTV